MQQQLPEVNSLQSLCLYLFIVTAVVVFSALLYALIRLRHAKGVVMRDAHQNLGIEIFWAVIPFIILIALAIPAIQVIYSKQDTEPAGRFWDGRGHAN